MRYQNLITALMSLGILGACTDRQTSPTALTDVVAPPQLQLHDAGPPTETTYLLTFRSLRPISETVLPSGVVIQDNEFSFAATGDWIGNVVGPAQQVIHTNGLITNKAIFTFEGTVLGLEGTVEFSHASVFDFSGGGLTVKTARDVILRGTGQLASLSGQGTIEAVGPGMFEGVFHVHFAP